MHPSNKIPVTIRGVTYASGCEAARALGVAPTTVNRARKNGHLEYVGLGTGANPACKTKKGERRAAKPITIRGVTYPSQKVAAEVLEVSETAISKALRRGSLDTVGTGTRAEWGSRTGRK